MGLHGSCIGQCPLSEVYLIHDVLGIDSTPVCRYLVIIVVRDVFLLSLPPLFPILVAAVDRRVSSIRDPSINMYLYGSRFDTSHCHLSKIKQTIKHVNLMEIII